MLEWIWSLILFLKGKNRHFYSLDRTFSLKVIIYIIQNAYFWLRNSTYRKNSNCTLALCIALRSLCVMFNNPHGQLHLKDAHLGSCRGRCMCARDILPLLLISMCMQSEAFFLIYSLFMEFSHLICA